MIKYSDTYYMTPKEYSTYVENTILTILEKQPCGRIDIVNKTGIPRTTVQDCLKRLLLQKVIQSKRVLKPYRGRPRTIFSLRGKKK